MPAAHKTVISFGLVAIPISMFTATQDNDIHFNQLHREDGGRIKYKKTCSHCGQEVGPGDIVKGFQYDRDHYVTVTDEELESLKSERDRTIQILHFAQLDQISPVYYERTYQAIPEPGGEKAFELLRAALMAEQKVAIGKTVMGNSEVLMCIVPRQEGVLISTMYFAAEVKQLQRTYQRPEIADAEMTMARTLINSMNVPYDPQQYRDEYQQRLRELIEAKIAGKEVTAPREEQPSNIINLMDALKASIEQQQAGNGDEGGRRGA